jgi:putative alpha-1,2-mannosidase
MRNTLLSALVLSSLLCIYGQQPKSPVDSVDPFIGAQGAKWFVFTPVALPFGLVKLAAASTNNIMGVTYSHGNEPSLLNAYIFDYMGGPDLSQKWIRAIMDTFYENTPSGYRGQDDDQGQLSGWFVLAAMGLYDISGGCGVDQQLYVHTPLFPKITIHLDRNYYKSGTFTIVTKNFSDASVYIKSATLNGEPLKGLHFDFAKVNANAKLELELSENAA